MTYPSGFQPSPIDGTRSLAHETVALNQVSWGAVFAGAATALVTQVVINLAGVAAGLASVGLDTAENPSASNFSLGAGAWFVVSGIVASLVGGLIAGRLAGKPLRGIAGLHGFVSWAVTTLV
ncbi:MAG: PhnA-like protein, partial [Methylorubrum extorquens]